MTALDQVQNYVLGGIIGGIIYNQDITVLQFLMVLIIWTLVVMVLQFLKNHNRFAKVMIDGRPAILVKNGELDVDELARVKRAVLEQNGQLTVLEYGDDESIRYPLISDGIINYDILEMISRDEAWLDEQLQKNGFKSSAEVFLGEYISGKLHFVGYPKK